MQGVVLFDRLQDVVVVHHLTVGAGALPGLEGERSQFLLLLQGLCGDRGGRGDRELELFIARVVLSEIVQRHHHVGAAGLLELAHPELAGSSGGAPVDVAAIVAGCVGAHGGGGEVGRGRRCRSWTGRRRACPPGPAGTRRPPRPGARCGGGRTAPGVGPRSPGGASATVDRPAPISRGRPPAPLGVWSAPRTAPHGSPRPAAWAPGTGRWRPRPPARCGRAARSAGWGWRPPRGRRLGCPPPPGGTGGASCRGTRPCRGRTGPRSPSGPTGRRRGRSAR